VVCLGTEENGCQKVAEFKINGYALGKTSNGMMALMVGRQFSAGKILSILAE
jgi:hypothetical protein